MTDKPNPSDLVPDTNDERPDHSEAILEIISDHFDQAEARLEDVYRSHFLRLRTVTGRHWRNRKDLASDLMALPRHTWNLVSTKLLRKTAKPIGKSRKAQEVEGIITDQLLDLKGLETKIEDYVKPFQLEFETEFSEILGQIPALNRKKFAAELENHIANLTTPTEGVREAVMFLAAGVVGKIFSEKVAFGSMIATGQALATNIYLGQLSWFGSLWASVFGVPAWVSVVGAGAGVLAGVLIAPLLSPLFELGINRLRGRKVLRNVVASARQELTDQRRDSFNVAGKIAIYLQTLPDLVVFARKTARVFV